MEFYRCKRQSIRRGRQQQLPSKSPFFSSFKGNYYILDLDKNYQWEVIGEPSRKYFWILSCDNQMKEGLYSGLIRKAKEEFGYDTNQVIMADKAVSKN